MPRKRMNGMGSITKLSGNRRKPYRARKTAGFKDGKQIFIDIGCFATKREAEEALAKYIVNPIDIALEKLTFEEVFYKWKVYEYSKLSENRKTIYDRMFKKCSVLHKKAFSKLRPSDFTTLIEENVYSVGADIKTLFNKMSNFALKNDYIMKDYSPFVEAKKRGEPKVPRKIFTEEEIEILWRQPYYNKEVTGILIMIYSGLRIGELLGLTLGNIDFENGLIIGAGIKTEAGKNRVIPIHSKIYPLILYRYKKAKFNQLFYYPRCSNMKMVYNRFKKGFDNILKEFGIQPHTIHDCRHTFATKMCTSGANDTITSEIIGHTDPVLTKKVYTHPDFDSLRREIEKIN